MFVGTLRLELEQPRFLPYLQQVAILVESLVNDVFQPWPMNNMQATWKYHDGTKHSYWSIRNSPHNITKEVFMKQFTRRAILENTILAAASAGIRLPLLSSEA